MTEEEFMVNLESVLHLGRKIGIEEKLADLVEWDSLAKMAFMAKFRKLCEKGIIFSDVREACTIRDLYDAVK